MTVFSISTILALTAASETAVAAATTGLIANPVGSLDLSENTLIAFAEAMNPSVPQTGGDVGPQSTTASGFQVGPGPSAGQGLGKVPPALWRHSPGVAGPASVSLGFGSPVVSVGSTPGHKVSAAATDAPAGDGTTAGSPVATVPNLSALTDLTRFAVDKILTAFGGVGAMNALNSSDPLKGKKLNREQIEILYRQGLRNFRGADLTWADLRGVILRRVFLEGANLTGADLTGAEFRYIKFDTLTKFPFFFWLRWFSFGRKHPGFIRVDRP